MKRHYHEWWVVGTNPDIPEPKGSQDMFDFIDWFRDTQETPHLLVWAKSPQEAIASLTPVAREAIGGSEGLVVKAWPLKEHLGGNRGKNSPKKYLGRPRAERLPTLDELINELK